MNDYRKDENYNNGYNGPYDSGSEFDLKYNVNRNNDYDRDREGDRKDFDRSHYDEVEFREVHSNDNRRPDNYNENRMDQDFSRRPPYQDDYMGRRPDGNYDNGGRPPMRDGRMGESNGQMDRGGRPPMEGRMGEPNGPMDRGGRPPMDGRMAGPNNQGPNNRNNAGNGKETLIDKIKRNKMVVIFASLLVVLIVLICVITNVMTGGNKKAVIYYGGMESPYFQYKLEEGKWIDLPGDLMEASTEVEGCTHKIEIKLGDSSYVVGCFRDGDGTKDDNNGNNYKFSEGRYAVRDGAVTALDTDVVVDAGSLKIKEFTTSVEEPASVGDEITISAVVSGGTGPYEYTFGVYDANGRRKELQSYDTNSSVKWVPDNKGEYILYLNARDSKGAVVTKEISSYMVEGLGISNITTSLEAPQKVNTSIELAIELDEGSNAENVTYELTVVNGADSIKLDVSEDGKAIWSPTSAGSYTINAKATDDKGREAEYSIDYVIEEQQNNAGPGNNNFDSNSVTIYYNNYDNAVIHYRLEGEDWDIRSDVPMSNSTDKAEYKHSATISLEGKSSIEFCFYNANNNHEWDSNNGNNYKANAGVYAVVNGQVVSIQSGNQDVDHSDNNVVIYYEGFDNAFIHYCIDGQQWTNLPGIAMTENNSLKLGYSYVITINTGGANGLQAVFNDGSNNNWDKLNGTDNFYFEKGKTYYVKNGKVKTKYFGF